MSEELKVNEEIQEEELLEETDEEQAGPIINTFDEEEKIDESKGIKKFFKNIGKKIGAFFKLIARKYNGSKFSKVVDVVLSDDKKKAFIKVVLVPKKIYDRELEQEKNIK